MTPWLAFVITAAGVLAATASSPGPVDGDAARRLVQASPPAAMARPGGEEHVHAPVPAAYAGAHLPARVWTDPRMLARGQEIYSVKCAACHGERGDGRGAAGAALSPRPADLTDAKMVAEMPGNYWFWRVSEGGQVEPFKSQGSAMPAWKQELSIPDRWAVIAYTHSLSGHRGAHTPSEHPELAHGHSHGRSGSGAPTPPAPAGAPGSSGATPAR